MTVGLAVVERRNGRSNIRRTIPRRNICTYSPRLVNVLTGKSLGITLVYRRHLLGPDHFSVCPLVVNRYTIRCLNEIVDHRLDLDLLVSVQP